MVTKMERWESVGGKVLYKLMKNAVHVKTMD